MKVTIDLHDTSGPLVAKQVRDAPRKLVRSDDRASAIERQITAIIDSKGGTNSTGRGAP
jgi:membrane fusion protein (multidrug efflux system)